MRRRRSIEVFSLSFLDCICCGFGAVILFYVIISARSGITSSERMEDLRSEVARLQKELVDGRENLRRRRNTVEWVTPSPRAAPESVPSRTTASTRRKSSQFISVHFCKWRLPIYRMAVLR